MNVVIVNKSDSTGGAAVVSRRLMLALRNFGINARMLVTEKKTDSAFVDVADSQSNIKKAFLSERLKIFIKNGFNRSSLFKIDTASDGLPIWKHPDVQNADIICLNWVNQGMLSLNGLNKLLSLGKPVVWTMHDMWNFTGICHHSGIVALPNHSSDNPLYGCDKWKVFCESCPLLGSKASAKDISFKVWNNKLKSYHTNFNNNSKLHFVAVSNWLANLAHESPLFDGANLSVIPNAFPIPDKQMVLRKSSADNPNRRFTIVMGAARLDDPVKGLPILIEATKALKRNFPDEIDKIKLVTFGNIKNPDSIEEIAIPHRHLGLISGEENLRNVYLNADAVISTSLYETLPGTLVEGQVYGCIPIAFNRGGQPDIIDHKTTGYLAEWDDDIAIAGKNIANGIIWAKNANSDAIRDLMFTSAQEKFDAPVIANKYLTLFNSLLSSAK